MNARIGAIGSFLIAGFAVGCGNHSAPRSSTRASALETDAEPGAHIQSATGHIEFVGRQGADNWYSFSAIKRIDASGEETVSGEVQYHSLQLSGTFVDVHGDVICVTIVGNVARIGGVGDFARNLPNPGPGWFYFTVVDNGEGGDNTDMGSNLFATTEAGAQQHCETGHVPPPPIFETQRGNVQVRD